MDDNDAVPPSDAEELEEIRAEEDLEGYWADVLPMITRNIEMMKASAGYSVFDNQRHEGAQYQASDTIVGTSHSDVGGAVPPRKRAKVRRVSVKYPVLTLCGFLSRYHTRCLMKI